nr:hypothetical protein [uncultured Oscillibacter sp.]
MRIKTNLFSQPGPFHMDSCQIEKLIELSAGDFAALTANPLRDWPCIAENRNWMFIANGTTHCVLALGKGNRDGILLCSENPVSPLCGAYVSGARDIVNAELDRAVDYIVREGLEQTSDGDWIVSYDELKETLGLTIRPDNGLGEMLLKKMADRMEVADVVLTFDGVDTVYCLSYCKNLEEKLPLELSAERKAFLFDCGVAAMRDLCKPDELYALLHDSFGMTLAEIGECDYIGDHYLRSISDAVRRVMYDRVDVRELFQMDGLPNDTYLMNDQRNCRFLMDGVKRLTECGDTDLGALLNARVIDIRKAPNGTTNVVLSGVTAEEMSNIARQAEAMEHTGQAMGPAF